MTLLRFTAAATLSLTAAATLGNKWMVLVFANGGDVTIDPNGAETINGAATKVLRNGGSGILVCDGTNFQFVSQNVVGKQPIWIPASAFSARATNGAAPGLTELATNKVMLSTFDFDGTTAEYIQYMLKAPQAWDLGTLTFEPVWTGAAGAGTVRFRMSAVAVSNDDALDVAQGTAQNSDDTFLAANDSHTGPESSAITVAGTPAAGDLLIIEVSRDPANDTKAEDAKLIGVMIYMTVKAPTEEAL